MGLDKGFSNSRPRIPAMPGDAAILGLKAGDAEPDPSVIGDDGGRSIRHPRVEMSMTRAWTLLRFRRARRGQVQRGPVRAPAFGLAFIVLSHGKFTPRFLVVEGSEQIVCEAAAGPDQVGSRDMLESCGVGLRSLGLQRMEVGVTRASRPPKSLGAACMPT